MLWHPQQPSFRIRALIHSRFFFGNNEYVWCAMENKKKKKFPPLPQLNRNKFFQHPTLLISTSHSIRLNCHHKSFSKEGTSTCVCERLYVGKEVSHTQRVALTLVVIQFFSLREFLPFFIYISEHLLLNWG